MFSLFAVGFGSNPVDSNMKNCSWQYGNLKGDLTAGHVQFLKKKQMTYFTIFTHKAEIETNYLLYYLHTQSSTEIKKLLKVNTLSVAIFYMESILPMNGYIIWSENRIES